MEPKVCCFCIMDTTDPNITFDEHGQCHHCRSYLAEIKKLPKFQEDASVQLDALISRIKDDGNSKPYDCVIGLSGGVDSTYVAYLVKEVLGLRPLAVHMDNGWNSELSIKNVENIVKKINIDLYTEVLDWEEFRDLQLAFLRASTPDSEIPTDHAIFATVRKVAKANNIKHVIIGLNFITERIMPASWSQGHGDWRYIRSIYKKFTGKRLKKLPHLSFWKRIVYSNIQYTSILDYVDADPNMMKDTIKEKLDWQEYGGKHYESTYTKFFQGYVLPKKFGFDKRKGHLSCLICSGLITRDEALTILSQTTLEADEGTQLKSYVAKKFKVSEAEIDSILAQEPKQYNDYPNMNNTLWWRFAITYIRPIYRWIKKKRGKLSHA